MYLQKLRQINNIPADAGHFLSTETDSTDFKNENLTTKIRRKRAEKPHLKKKYIPKNLETDKTIKQIRFLRNIGEINKSNKVAKNC